MWKDNVKEKVRKKENTLKQINYNKVARPTSEFELKWECAIWEHSVGIISMCRINVVCPLKELVKTVASNLLP